MEVKLVELVEYYLSVYLHDNAIFMAERLVALAPTESHKLLLATCYIHAGKGVQALTILENSREPANKYLLGKCLIDVGEYGQAEDVLLGAMVSVSDDELKPQLLGSPFAVPNGPAGMYLLGVAAQRTQRFDRAILFHSIALHVDPFLWISYEALCALGAAPDVNACFSSSSIRVTTETATKASATGQSSDIDYSRAHSGMKRGFAAVSGSREEPAHGSAGSSVLTPETMESPITPAMKLQMLSPEILSLAAHAAASSIASADAISLHEDTPADEMTKAGDDSARRVPVRRKARIPSSGTSQLPSGGPINRSTVAALSFSAPHSVVRGSSSARPDDMGSVHELSSIAGTPSHIAQYAEADASIRNSIASTGRILARTAFTPLVHKLRQFTLDTHASHALQSNSDRNRAVRSLLFSGDEDSAHRSLGPAGIIMSSKSRLSTSGEKGPQLRGHSLESARSIRGTSNIQDSAGMKSDVAQQLVAGSLLILGMLKLFGSFAKAVAAFDLTASQKALQKIPASQSKSGYVLYSLGKLYTESGHYDKARLVFREMRKRAPEKLVGLDIFSTVLWHLRAREELQSLAQGIYSRSPENPIALCIMANSCSLRKDHHGAVKFLEVATKRDPSYVYAHTLLGHECLALGEFDKATSHFMDAVGIDARHYNAHYGLGIVHLKQERLDMAEAHFKQAIHINQFSAVLHCYIGMVYHSTKRFDDALATFNKAIEIDPANPQAMYQRSLVYLSVGKLESARLDLVSVLERAPGEVNILIQLGKINKKLGRTQEAVENFNAALKGARNDKEVNNIKNYLNTMQSGSEEDDSIF